MILKSIFGGDDIGSLRFDLFQTFLMTSPVGFFKATMLLLNISLGFPNICLRPLQMLLDLALFRLPKKEVSFLKVPILQKIIPVRSGHQP